MNNLTSRHIQETESDRRAIRDGWYATNETGQVCSGRFSTQEDCQAHIEQEQTDIAPRGGSQSLRWQRGDEATTQRKSLDRNHRSFSPTGLSKNLRDARTISRNPGFPAVRMCDYVCYTFLPMGDRPMLVIGSRAMLVIGSAPKT